MKIQLPAEFTDEMKKILGGEYEAFLSSYDAPRRGSLRVNTLKISPEEFVKTVPFHLEKIPWTENGYYYEQEDLPSRHPFYRAGLYYLQEASAMAPASALPVVPGDRVLDLCAAPGGKSTELGARLQGEGLLLANEISSSRARALLRNIELFGIANACVTNAVPARLLARYPLYFDKVLVDAPCSGEGMFRKDEDVVKAWYPEKVRECARIQRSIIVQAADMLRPGGMMLYSTCTFAPEEDELVIAHLLAERPEMELLDIPRTAGREGFAEGLSAERLSAAGLAPEDAGKEGTGLPALEKTVRLWPHRVSGEGHFLALLRKKETCPAAGNTEEEGSRTGRTGKHAGKKKRESGTKRGASLREQENGKLVRSFTSQFPEDVCGRMGAPGQRLELHDGQSYLTREEYAPSPGIACLRSGLYLGEVKKDRFEPAQEYALALPRIQSEALIPAVSFSATDERLERYFRGESVFLEEGESSGNGWKLVCAEGFPVGWGRQTGNQLKNRYPSGWRIR